jgi:hypothetical protein
LYDKHGGTEKFKAYLFSIRLCSRTIDPDTNHLRVYKDIAMGDVVTIHGCPQRAIIRSITGHVSYDEKNIIRLKYTRLPITPASLTLPAL